MRMGKGLRLDWGSVVRIKRPRTDPKLTPNRLRRDYPGPPVKKELDQAGRREGEMSDE